MLDYTGRNCETKIILNQPQTTTNLNMDPLCRPVPCGANGNCVVMGNSVGCLCNNGWGGQVNLKKFSNKKIHFLIIKIINQKFCQYAVPTAPAQCTTLNCLNGKI